MVKTESRNQIFTYVGWYLALWASALVLLRTYEAFEASEALIALAILGFIFPPSLGWLRAACQHSPILFIGDVSRVSFSWHILR